MSKQQDALTALATGGITERAEAVRLLAVIGDSEVLDALLTAALQDRSPGVRLAAASAAADVLARYRLPPHFGDLGNAQRRAIEGQLRAIDLPVFSCSYVSGLLSDRFQKPTLSGVRFSFLNLPAYGAVV